MFFVFRKIVFRNHFLATIELMEKHPEFESNPMKANAQANSSKVLINKNSATSENHHKFNFFSESFQ